MRGCGGEGQEKTQVPFAGAVLLFFLCSLFEVLEAKVLPTALHVHFLFIAVLYVAWYTTPLRGAAAGSLLGLVEDYLFGSRAQVVIDPSEDKLRTEFEGVQRSFIPMHAIIRIDEVEKEGVAKITDSKGENVTPFPFPVPRKDGQS